MTKAAQSILTAFEKLSPSGQREVAVALLRRSAAAGELSAVAMHPMADESLSTW